MASRNLFKEDTDPAACFCRNTCTRREGRGACPCKAGGRVCSRLCRCAQHGHLPCTNRGAAMALHMMTEAIESDADGDWVDDNVDVSIDKLY